MNEFTMNEGPFRILPSWVGNRFDVVITEADGIIQDGKTITVKGRASSTEMLVFIGLRRDTAASLCERLNKAVEAFYRERA